ncbi:hypothetical protein SG34_023050 [Thalassomonas viridans]|uniref:Uncharacterized protein n=1 Tax=Thalassomonas viridans TaxID=137584 RepID=A0AAE9Z0X9_9GAMM|nr:hypothetical protein [Thalassomonas viridans]WDE04192.1 hypothetical protein SG34_023050 [Thalassomonas viridans]
MSESNSTSGDAPLDEEARREQLSSEFIDLVDDFSKFSEECAFLFDGFSAVAQEPESITPDTSEGIRHLCFWLKYEVIGYRYKIDELRERWKAIKREL